MKADFQEFKSVEQALESIGEYVTQVRGESMYPMLRYRRDPVYLVPVTSTLKPMDVAAYKSENKYIVHRILEVRDDCYVFRGDNCCGKEYVPKDKVIAKAAGFWRDGKFISCEDPLYRAYSRIWVGINPLVRLHHRAKALILNAKSRLKDSLKK